MTDCLDRGDFTQTSDNSCFVTWKNELFVFGGRGEHQQISRLFGQKLERVGDLSFDHYDGACSVMAHKFIFLCFGWGNYQRCRRSTGPLERFSEVALSTHKHQSTQTSCSDSKFLSSLSYSLFFSITSRSGRPVPQKKREIRRWKLDRHTRTPDRWRKHLVLCCSLSRRKPLLLRWYSIR